VDALAPLPFDAPLAGYEARARQLLEAHRARVPEVLALIHRRHPRFLDEKVPWKPRGGVSPEDIAAAPFDEEDARLTVARAHDFGDWAALVEHVAGVARRGAEYRFEHAVEALVGGDLEGLRNALTQDPALVRRRSSRRTHFDPPVHGATLLHYVAANGVEGHRQRTPPNAVALTRVLLEAGAEADALADFYGCACATLSLLVSSSHPAQAGVQGALVELLLDHGAALEGRGERWGSPLVTALVFGCMDAARALVRRGARVDDIRAAAGLGRVEDVRRLLPGTDARGRHLALAFAAQLGQAEVVRLLLDAGEDPDRFNPEGAHGHATPLHNAVLGGHMDVVRLLVERGARLDIEDRIWRGTPLGWACHAGRTEAEAYLRAQGAS